MDKDGLSELSSDTLSGIKRLIDEIRSFKCVCVCGWVQPVRCFETGGVWPQVGLLVGSQALVLCGCPWKFYCNDHWVINGKSLQPPSFVSCRVCYSMSSSLVIWFSRLSSGQRDSASSLGIKLAGISRHLPRRRGIRSCNLVASFGSDTGSHPQH